MLVQLCGIKSVSGIGVGATIKRRRRLSLIVTFFDIEKVVVQEWEQILAVARDDIVRASEGLYVSASLLSYPVLCKLTDSSGQ